MNPEEIRQLVEQINYSDNIYYLILAIIISILGSFVVEYFRERGKNWATKNDIEEITKKIESVKAVIQNDQEIKKLKRDLKYKALLNSLSIIDSHLSNFLIFKDGTKINKQYSSVIEIRACHNNLILTCENAEIVALFTKMLSAKENLNEDEISVLMKDLNEYRNWIRMELGFGSELSLDKDFIWFAKVNFESDEK